jgi:hypothetical protein
MNTAEQAIGMRREYRMKGWYRAFLLIMGAPAVSGGIVMCALALKSASFAFPLLVTALFLGFGIYLIALGSRSRIVLDGSRIEIRGAFTDRSADASEVEGYRTISSRNGKYTQIYLINGRRPMSFSNLFERDSTFDSWFRKVPNLDKRDRDALLEKISNEQELGATPQDRLNALAQAKTNSILAIVVAVAAAIAANWGIPALYVLFSFVLVLVPIALAVMLHRAPLLYTVFKRKADPRSELLYALIAASFGLLIRARADQIRFSRVCRDGDCDYRGGLSGGVLPPAFREHVSRADVFCFAVVCDSVRIRSDHRGGCCWGWIECGALLAEGD